MKILSLNASFGKLNQDALELSGGLNVITLPNEAGKSTWSQFILAMFYGIDTSERAKAGTLPAKTKFKPWSGAPMQGSMDLEWNGRRITIERTSTGRGLMNNFRAYETESGLPVAELTAENCGKTLLGVERSVFERSAFIRQAGLAVTQDSALEQRLQALVTTGDEGASFSEAERVLKDRKNYLGRARTGQLDHLQQELEQVQTQLQELEELGQSIYTLHKTRQKLEADQQDLQHGLSLARAHEAAAKLQQLTLAEQRANDSHQALQDMQQACAELPDEATLAVLEQQLDALPQPPSPPGEVPAAPQLPEALQNMDEAQIRKTVADDLASLDTLSDVKKPSLLLKILSCLFSIGGIAAVFFNLPLGLGLVAIGQFLLQLGLHQSRKAKAANTQQARMREEILQKYHAADRDEIVQLSERCCAELALHARQMDQYAEALQTHEQAQRDYEAACSAILTQVRIFRPVSALSEVRPALRDAKAAYEALRRAEAEHRQADQSYVNLKSALGDLPAPDPTLLLQPVTRNRAELERDLENNARQLLQLRSQMDQLSGRRSAIGNPDTLAARQEALLEQCEATRLHVQALDIAMTALTEANREVQTRISPAMAKKAGEYFAELTGGRYDKVQLDADFSAFARLSGESVHQSLSYLSAGTSDQLYLSVRLAICALALDEERGAPLILDDALAFFDDQRCRTALNLLNKISEQRQVLLFTCQNRESMLLK